MNNITSYYDAIDELNDIPYKVTIDIQAVRRVRPSSMPTHATGSGDGGFFIPP